MKVEVRILHNTGINGRQFKKGQIVQLERRDAEHLRAFGSAEIVGEQTPPRAAGEERSTPYGRYEKRG